MNKLYKYLFLSLTLSLTLTLFSQEPANTPPPAKDGNKTGAQKSDTVAMLKEYTPIAQLDPTFTVKEISYLRRAAHNGKGDVLDVQINIENNITPPAKDPAKDAKEEESGRKYSFYVLAYHESKIPVVNKLAPPPAWRENDPNKLDRIIDFSVLSPEKITPKDVWGEALLKQKQEKSEKEKVKGYKYIVGEPSLSEYMLYLTKNPGKAQEFRLYSEAVPVGKTIETNYKSSPEELKRDMNNLAATSHTYTIFNAKYKTTITTHHYSQFRSDFFFFNRVAILIFDEKGTLVYRSIEDIGKKREHK